MQADDPRHHDLSDAFAIPGVYPVSNPILIDTAGLVVRNGIASKITVKEDSVEIAAGIGICESRQDGQGINGQRSR